MIFSSSISEVHWKKRYQDAAGDRWSSHLVDFQYEKLPRIYFEYGFLTHVVPDCLSRPSSETTPAKLPFGLFLCGSSLRSASKGKLMGSPASNSNQKTGRASRLPVTKLVAIPTGLLPRSTLIPCEEVNLVKWGVMRGMVKSLFLFFGDWLRIRSEILGRYIQSKFWMKTWGRVVLMWTGLMTQDPTDPQLKKFEFLNP